MDTIVRTSPVNYEPELLGENESFDSYRSGTETVESKQALSRDYLPYGNNQPYLDAQDGIGVGLAIAMTLGPLTAYAFGMGV